MPYNNNMASFEGKVVAVTGAASGIGLAVARELAGRGAKLALCDVQADLLQKAVEELRASGAAADDVVGTTVDVSKDAEVDAWIAATVARFGGLHGAANMAGVVGRGSKMFANLAEMPNELWDSVIAVNLTGCMYCVRAELRVMQRGAAIVNAASIAGFIGRPGLAPYTASKHGIIGITKNAAKEYGAKGIRVNAVAP